MDEILKKVRGVEDENSRLTTLSQTLTNTLEESKAKLALAGTQLQALTLASLELHKELSSQKSLAEARELEIKSMMCVQCARSARRGEVALHMGALTTTTRPCSTLAPHFAPARTSTPLLRRCRLP